MQQIYTRQVPIQIPVLAAGKGWLAADKPNGMTVHNESGRDICSLAAALVQGDPALKSKIAVDPDFGIHPVHRLDKETSGVILLAANREMFRFFSRQFESRQVKKQYVAILHGRLEAPEGNTPWGSWQWPLAKTAGGRQNPQGPSPRQHCETRFRILDHSMHYTMVEIEILTGRIHQIRRHAKLAGHPVVGDGRYGSPRALKYLQLHHAFDRLALHALSLTLYLPDGQTPVAIQTPGIPIQMKELFENDSALNPPKQFNITQEF
ncbi:MAG: RNA pseudouridine synthase [Desulfobacterales bacterium]|jgi:RluA family pseudouridine synthase|nr:RNA pseudouridine synthase [Desulfobacterales bacterium]